MSDEADNDQKVEEASPLNTSDFVALDHAWNWFKCHADQRMALFRFYVLVIGGLATAVGVLHQQKEDFICVVVSLFAAFVCFCFMRFDKRTSDLVRLGERAMRSEQQRLVRVTGNTDFDIALKADQLTGPWPYTYRRIIRALTLASSGLFCFVCRS